MNLENKVVIITGASSGIGEATAIKLADNGAKVVLMARREDRLKELKEKIESNGGKAIVVTGDVTSKTDFENAVATTKKELQRKSSAPYRL